MILKNVDEATIQETPVEYPPPYTSGSSQGYVVKPSNFIHVDRTHNGISETYVVDPRMVIPASMLTPLEEGDERKNLSLYSKHGTVQADITILPGNDAQRTTIRVKSMHGHVKCKLHRTLPSAFQLEAGTKQGHVEISLPRTFQGPVIVTHHDRVKISDGLLAHQTPFTEANNTTKFFVGDTSPYFAKGGREWFGDEAVLDSGSGNVWIGYEDEVDKVDELPSLNFKDSFQRDFSQRFNSSFRDKFL